MLSFFQMLFFLIQIYLLLKYQLTPFKFKCMLTYSSEEEEWKFYNGSPLRNNNNKNSSEHKGSEKYSLPYIRCLGIIRPKKNGLIGVTRPTLFTLPTLYISINFQQQKI